MCLTKSLILEETINFFIGGDIMQSMGIVGVFGFLGIIKAILEVLLYISVIMVSFKVVQALNVYINRNSR